jgi:hypothetical protein
MANVLAFTFLRGKAHPLTKGIEYYWQGDPLLAFVHFENVRK